MQLTSEQQIFVITNYSRARSFKKVQQLFDKRFRDTVSPLLKINIWKNIKKYKTERLTLNLNKDRSGCRGTEHKPKTQENIIEDPIV